MPVMASTGEGALSVGLSRNKLKLPVFKLPAIDISKYAIQENNNSETKTEKKLAQIETLSYFMKFESLEHFLTILSTKSKTMSKREKHFLKTNMQITENDVENIEAEIRRKHGTEEGSNKNNWVTVFLSTKYMNENMAHPTEIFDTAASGTVSSAPNVNTHNITKTISQDMFGSIRTSSSQSHPKQMFETSPNKCKSGLSKTIGPGGLSTLHSMSMTSLRNVSTSMGGPSSRRGHRGDGTRNSRSRRSRDRSEVESRVTLPSLHNTTRQSTANGQHTTERLLFSRSQAFESATYSSPYGTHGAHGAFGATGGGMTSAFSLTGGGTGVGDMSGVPTSESLKMELLKSLKRMQTHTVMV